VPAIKQGVADSAFTQGCKCLNSREKQIEELIAPTVESLGCEVWGIEYFSQGKYSKLLIYIERADGIDVDLCATVSKHVSDLLDVEELISSRYTLEVSSPGMDRILFKEQHYLDHVGERVEIRLNYPFEGRKRISGILAGIEDQMAIVQEAEDEFLLPLENVQKARLVPTFD
jgi:ribosome maturation factor RimP